MIEYLNILLSTQVIFGGIFLYILIMYKNNITSLLSNITQVTLPNGVTVTTQKIEENNNEKKIEIDTTLINIKNKDIDDITKLYYAEQSKATYWEYIYLNSFLVQSSQYTLDWFYKSSRSVTHEEYHNMWITNIPVYQDRLNIINTLMKHRFIISENNFLSISSKGKQYVEWRGLYT